jgi:hypothetical protein
MTGSLSISLGSISANVNDGSPAGFFTSATRSVSITPYYNEEGSDRGSWLKAYNTSGGAFNKFTITAKDVSFDIQGNVGISTLNPTSNLHVVGNANVTTTMTVGGLRTTKNIVEVTVANTNTNGANNINLDESNFFTRTLTANCQFTFRNAPASGNAQNFTLVVVQDASGSRVPSWANTIYWAGGSQPPATTTANARDVWQFVTFDGGTTYYGTLAIKAAS